MKQVTFEKLYSECSSHAPEGGSQQTLLFLNALIVELDSRPTTIIYIFRILGKHRSLSLFVSLAI